MDFRIFLVLKFENEIAIGFTPAPKTYHTSGFILVYMVGEGGGLYNGLSPCFFPSQ